MVFGRRGCGLMVRADLARRRKGSRVAEWFAVGLRLEKGCEMAGGCYLPIAAVRGRQLLAGSSYQIDPKEVAQAQ